MSARRAIQDYGRIVVGVICVMIVGAFAAIYAQVSPAQRPHANLAFYSDDDGQTWFEDQALKLTPFDHNGRQAVAAMIYSIDGKKSVGYLIRFSKKAAAIFARVPPNADGSAAPVATLAPFFADPGLQEVKLPGPGHAWMNMRSSAAASILTPQRGSSADIEVVSP